jgi:hypothetical protein
MANAGNGETKWGLLQIIIYLEKNSPHKAIEGLYKYETQNNKNHQPA